MFFSSEVSDTPSETSGSEATVSELIDIGVIIEQYASTLVDVSSQFGSDASISYVAQNVIGKPKKFPHYGDFPETFAFRTYGDWWSRRSLKSTHREYQPKNLPTLVTDDFIVLDFEDAVFPEAIRVIETYNPGAVIRIWAYTNAYRWILLWEAVPHEWMHARDVPTSRMFSPQIQRIGVPCKTIRLEYNHSRLKYFTELDAVILIGRKATKAQHNLIMKRKQTEALKGPIQKRLETVRFRPHARGDQELAIQEFFIHDFNRVVHELMKNQENCAIVNLPHEILFKILSFLNLKDLFRVSRVCRRFYEVAADPLMYAEVNLKAYWHLTTGGLLRTLVKRGRLMRKIDLSWCGLHKLVTSMDFEEFILTHGTILTHLRLNSCQFLTVSCIRAIGNTCENLRELSLRGCSLQPEETSPFYILTKLKHLEKLDLYRTCIETEPLIEILKNNPNLQHLNLGLTILHMDTVAETIAEYNKEIISVDFWKSHSFTLVGLTALSTCKHLEEVDFGWGLRDQVSVTDSLLLLLQGCPNLKKLFLAAVRGLTDRDLTNISKYCPNLEQLDLMGIFGISTDKVEEVLIMCPKLQMMDLSFCNQLDEIRVALWQQAYNVQIKRTVNVEPLFPF